MMRGKDVLLALAAILLAVSTFGSVIGQVSPLGIKARDTFVYSYSGTWQSNQTGVEAPSSIRDYGNLNYITSAIIEVNGVSVTMNSSYWYGDSSIYMEVTEYEYGGGFWFLPFFTPSNLSAGSLIPGTFLEGSPDENCYINSTFSQAFGSETRQVNHLSVRIPFEGYQDVSCNAYWDQATGALLKIMFSYSNRTGDTVTDWSLTLNIGESNLFAAPVLPLPSPTQTEQPTQTLAPTNTPVDSPDNTTYYIIGGGVVVAAIIVVGLVVYFKKLGKMR
jgi:hypothetical protein